MAGNNFGEVFKISTFGESHGRAIGVVIDGCPAGLMLSSEDIQLELDRRKPGQSHITTARKEKDQVQILSGVFEGRTLGTPIALLIENEDQESKDYSHLKNAFRPSHADFTYQEKFGIRDYRGGGRASARETATRVAAGAIAKKMNSFLSKLSVKAFVSSIANIHVEKGYQDLDLDTTENNLVRCPDEETSKHMIRLIETAKAEGDSLGGVITCVIKDCPIGLGEPVFDKLEAQLAKAMLSIPAVKGFEIGSGFEGTKMKGSEHNDVFEIKNDKVVTQTNNSGGIQGGISNGMDIYFRVAFKPTATIMQKQHTLDAAKNQVELEAKGRHDPCVLPRAVPIVEAMASLVLADYLLMNRLNKL